MLAIFTQVFEDAESILDVSSTGHSGDLVLVYQGKNIMIEIKNKL